MFPVSVIYPAQPVWLIIFILLEQPSGNMSLNIVIRMDEHRGGIRGLSAGNPFVTLLPLSYPALSPSYHFLHSG
ncbi:hypothetical protein CG430_21980 [Pantoea ananatis]|jgi:hypothetical protein|nr:hypothetical protein CG430_21980 [Pantoea ananatis]